MEELLELGARIRQRIRELGYKNPSQFADAKGYRITYVHKWITGTMPSTANLLRLADDLEVDPGWLLTGKGCSTSNPRSAGPGRRLMVALAMLGAGTILSLSPGGHKAAWAQANQTHNATSEWGYYVNSSRSRRLRSWWSRLMATTPPDLAWSIG